MIRRAVQLLTLAALVNLVYQLWPRGDADQLIPVRNAFGKFGYIDGSGRVRIEFDWKAAYPFFPRETAKVMGEDDKDGVIDRSGKVIVQPEWDSVGKINSGGMIQVVRDGLSGWVDRNGKMVIQPEWDAGTSAYHGSFSPVYLGKFAILSRDGKDGMLNSGGEIVIPPVWERIVSFGPQGITAAKDEDGWKLINMEGEVVVNELENEGLDYFSIYPFADNGLARVLKESYPPEGAVGPRFMTGWIDLSGKEVIPAVWENGSDFGEFGLAPVQRESDGMWGWINEAGEEVLPFKWRGTWEFDSNGRAIVYDGERRGLVNRQGELVADTVWQEIGFFDDEGYSRVMDSENRVGFISPDGEVLVRPVYDWAGWYDGKGHVRIKYQGKVGLIDRKGESVFFTEGDMVSSYDDNDRVGLERFDEATQSIYFAGWMDRSGNLVIESPGREWHKESISLFEQYVLTRKREIGWPRSWWVKLQSWVTSSEPATEEFECRAYDKDGNLIWSSTWMRKTTKAWFYLVISCFALLVVMWIGGRRKRASL